MFDEQSSAPVISIDTTGVRRDMWPGQQQLCCRGAALPRRCATCPARRQCSHAPGASFAWWFFWRRGQDARRMALPAFQHAAGPTRPLAWLMEVVRH
eukprot:243287-Chlamydomonas_euryale.AAC.6